MGPVHYKAVIKTLLTPRHSLYAFSRQDVGAGGSQQKMVVVVEI